MGAQIVVLWTDLLLLVLCAAMVVAFWRMRQDGPARAAWARVARRPLGMASLTVLALLLAVALLDSLHFRVRLPDAPDGKPVYAAEVLSVLDWCAGGLREHQEATYSAPLALYSFARETVERPGEHAARVYPRLQFAGQGVADAAARDADVLLRAGYGLLSACGLWSLIVVALVFCLPGDGFVRRFQRLWGGHYELAWRAALASLLALLLVGGVLVALAQHYHVFGTDKVGQDVFYLTLKSLRTAWVIGTLTTIVTMPLAVVLGVLAGYLGGWVDDAIQYVYTVLNAIPGVLLIAAAVLMMQVVIGLHPQWFDTAAQRADARLLALCVILGMTSWTGLCRLLRAETLKLRELEYVQAARAFGVGTWRILMRHVLPNLTHIVLISLVMDFSSLVLAEAVLSYVGIGVDPGTTSFGTMINAARMELAREPAVWWSLVAAFSCMFVLVLAANLFADAVRDAFDPRSA